MVTESIPGSQTWRGLDVFYAFLWWFMKSIVTQLKSLWSSTNLHVLVITLQWDWKVMHRFWPLVWKRMYTSEQMRQRHCYTAKFSRLGYWELNCTDANRPTSYLWWENILYAKKSVDMFLGDGIRVWCLSGNGRKNKSRSRVTMSARFMHVKR